MMRAPSEVVEAARLYGVSLSEALEDRLAAYLEALFAANAEFNLTAVTDPHEAWIKHVADSLSLVPELAQLPSGSRVVDVGSGGGLPGIPLAIALPELRFTLLEATGKKARFLEHAAGQRLGLGNVQVVCERAETFGQAKGREQFHAVTSRACSPLPVLLELTLPLARVGGTSLAIKGARAEQEIEEAARALSILHGRVASLRKTQTGTVIRIEKTARTPTRYPRRPGEPKRNPL